MSNSIELIMQAQSQNEKLARNVVGAFFAQLNPTVEQLEELFWAEDQQLRLPFMWEDSP